MAIKQRPDSPTNNFATMSPLDEAGGLLFSEGNLKITANTGWDGSRANFSYPLTGKWYWETFCVARSTGASVGILSTSAVMIGDLANSSTGYVYNSGDGSKYNNASWSIYGISWGQNNIIGVLWDSDTGTLTFYKDGISQGTAWSGLTGEFSPAINVNGSDSMIANFGQDPTFGGNKVPSGGTNSDGSYPDKSATGIGGFFYEPPAGALALCTANLQEMTPDVDNDVPKDYFKTVLWTGNGTGTSRTIDIGIETDLVWSKRRSADASHPLLYDSVRGAAKDLKTSLTNSEDVNHTNGYISSGLGSNSITYTDGNSANFPRHNYNDSGINYVVWCWKAGGASVTNNDGSFTSTVSANTDAGFSIVSWTGNGSIGATIGHGLGTTPDCVIMKRRNGSTNWPFWNSTFNATTFVFLQSSTNAATTENYFNSTLPSSSVLTLSANSEVNASGGTYIAYCWHSVEGYSKFGSYTGNGSTDGPFVYCGFRPAFVMVKSSTVATNWYIFDSERGSQNPIKNVLFANTAESESVNTHDIDFVSNGFKVRQPTGYGGNNSGATYIFMAFAEQPFNYATAR